MPGVNARERILRLFHEMGPRKPEDALSFRSIRVALSPDYTKGTVSARLSELVQEGILEKDERGKYRLAYADGAMPRPLRDLSALLAEQLPRRALHQTVLWDATPFLAAREDGTLAAVHVLETARFTGGSTARMLTDHWASKPVPHIQEFADRDTVLDAVVGELQVPAPRGARQVLVGPAEGRYAGTVLDRTGLRLATPERIVVDFLELSEPSMVDAVRLRLTSQATNIDPDRLFAAAKERDLLPSLFAVLNQLRGALPRELEESYARKLSGSARAIVEGRD
ncbi:MAG: hypothetical protein ACT4PT_02690 [Methanobacteriota archaeon]